MLQAEEVLECSSQDPLQQTLREVFQCLPVQNHHLPHGLGPSLLSRGAASEILFLQFLPPWENISLCLCSSDLERFTPEIWSTPNLSYFADLVFSPNPLWTSSPREPASLCSHPLILPQVRDLGVCPYKQLSAQFSYDWQVITIHWVYDICISSLEKYIVKTSKIPVLREKIEKMVCQGL